MSVKCKDVRPEGMAGSGNGGGALPAHQHPLRFTKSGRLRKPSKFRNKKTVCLSRHEHDSRHESDYCNRLMARVQHGEIIGYDVQVPFDLVVDGQLICRHILDFGIIGKDAGIGEDFLYTEVHDAKGFRTAVWSIKHKLFQALYPAIKYVVVNKGKDRSPCPVNQKIRTMIQSSRSKKS